jgi:hypothetical protein
MARRLRKRLAEEGIAFKQHRLRSTCARRLHEAGHQDTAIMEILGWSSMAMLSRYLGKIPVAQLKRYPTTLERIFRTAIGGARLYSGRRLPGAYAGPVPVTNSSTCTGERSGWRWRSSVPASDISSSMR